MLDGVRLRLDTFPRGRLGRRLSGHRYHPLPWLDLPGSYRSAWTVERWQTMLPVISDLQPQSGLDIGCNAGYLTLRLAETGIPVVGIESDPASFRIALAARRAAHLDQVGLLDMHVDPTTVHALPVADATIFLSVWHHMVRAWGMATAKQVLKAIWDRTGKVMFFETGENEMPRQFGLPHMDDPTRWVTELLEEVCANATVRPLGRHRALAPDGSEHARGMFAVVRTGEAEVRPTA